MYFSSSTLKFFTKLAVLIMYAIVDIETTGSYAAANGITEIAIYISDGKKVVEKFETLVNPLQPIPKYIQGMTGISNAMVASAPTFDEIAEQVYELLKDKVFIAHNVNFDYSFVKAQLAACGYELNTKKLCTVRLSRKLIPGLYSYSLGKLCDQLNIPIENRHRAGGDTAATAYLFHLLFEKDSSQFIENSLKKKSKEQSLPPHVPKEDFDKLPYTPGVYYFHNAKGKIIYVGKAVNIKYRVNSHFSNNATSKQKQNFLQHTHRITCVPCGTELMASILESVTIKKLWPIFNTSQKRFEEVYSLFVYEDLNGYFRLAIDKNKKRSNPIFSFHYLADGQSILRKVVKEFNLCPKLCFLQKDAVPCKGVEEKYCKGGCTKKEAPSSYNDRVLEAIKSIKNEPSFAIVEKGLNGNDKSYILMQEGSFIGMGYFEENEELDNIQTIKERITPYKENLFVRNLIKGYAARNPEKVVWFP